MSSDQGATAYGNFHNFCRDSTLPVCNLFSEYKNLASNNAYGNYQPGQCELTGIPLSGGRHLRNLGLIILDGIAVLVALLLLWRTNRKRAAVGRRELQLFFICYIILSICEVLSLGGFPLEKKIRIAFSGGHIAAIVACTWLLMLQGAVGFQALHDGTFFSLFLVLGSTLCIFCGTGFVALDTGYNWTGYWNTTLIQQAPNREYALYTLYILCPLVFVAAWFCLETYLVLKVLGEIKPMLLLIFTIILFAAGQVFDFVISIHVCNALDGKIDGSLFQTFFTLTAVCMAYAFWKSITEDDWPEVPQAQQSEVEEAQAYA